MLPIGSISMLVQSVHRMFAKTPVTIPVWPTPVSG
jgi:hypothetical protein